MHIIIIGIVLVLVGIFAIYSVSVFESFNMTLWRVERWLRETPTNYYFFFEQLQKLGVWIILAVILYLIPRKRIKQWKSIIFLFTLVGVLLLFTSMGTELNGSRAWLLVGWGTIQPGEFFKLWFVLFLWSWLIRKREIMNEVTWYAGFLIITWLCYLIFVLIPDLWTVYVLAPVSLLMFRYAGGKKRYILITCILGVLGMALAATQFNHIRVRLDYFLHPEKYESSRDVGRQNKQALLAVWWWWRVGKWYGKWLQKFGYLPEAQSDFIFAALAEEIGFIGNVMIICLYLLLWRLVTKRLPHIRDEEDQLIVVWILSLILMQAFINIGVNIRLLPLTGLTLPFFSHGWSALLINIAQIMLLHKICIQK